MDSIDISDIYVQSKTIKQLLLFFSLPFFSFVLGGLIFIPSVCNALFFFIRSSRVYSLFKVNICD